MKSAERWHLLQVWVLLAVLVGALTGLAVATLHWVVHVLIWHPLSLRSDTWVALLPLVGLVLATLFITASRSRSTQTTEAYIEAFHDPDKPVATPAVPFRIAASIATISLGGSMGLEGPSIYMGSAIGDVIERRFPTLLREEHAKVLLIAGAAAGIAAIFKAPLTGIVFALEVPYQDEMARHALIPAIFSAATSYLVFVALIGTAPLFPVRSAALSYTDLLASIGVGVACGLGARAFVALFHQVVTLGSRIPFGVRPFVGGSILLAVGLMSIRLFGTPLALGPGYIGLAETSRGALSAELLVWLLILKMISTSTTAASNGVGGLFFPSALLGSTIGSLFGRFVPGPPSLFAVVGVAAFIGAAYNVPLAGVTFVAETTGAPGYIIPGLLAAAIAYLVSGRRSLSEHQRARGGS